jgi:fumarate reductase flavoprotein subunit
MNTRSEEISENLEADIVIIGGGGSGLAAAISAEEAGAKNIIVLEKASTLGGNAALSHGMFAVGSQAQKQQGVTLSEDEVYKDRMALSEWTIDPKLTRDLINRSKDMLQWLTNKGLKFEYLTSLTGVGTKGSGDIPMVFHMNDAELDKDKAVGLKLVETLVRECQKPGVKTLCDTKAKKILTDSKGQVNGVLAEAKGKELKITAKSAIIAAGGFGGNVEMLNKYFPSLKDLGDAHNNGLPQMMGDGIVMAAEAGAMEEYQVGIGFIGPHHYPWSRSLNLLVRRPHLMLVNKTGERYIGSPLKGSNNALNRQPGKVCYALLDSDLLQDIIRKREIFNVGEKNMGDNGAWLDELEDELKKGSAEGRAKIADSWDEMAKYLGAKPEVLKATVERYNSFCEKGYDEDFLKDKEYLIPLRTPPYYAVMGRQGFDGTMGGIKINQHMEVISKQGNPIDGLYATGDNAASFLSAGYKYPGQGLTFAIYSGYTAGRNAAKYISGNR